MVGVDFAERAIEQANAKRSALPEVVGVERALEAKRDVGRHRATMVP